MSLTQTFAILSLLAPWVSCHMEMSWPYAMDSKYNPANKNPDYNLIAPLAADGSEFPCKGYQKQSWPAVTTLQTGDTDPYNITLQGSAFHNGGSCQIALSFDNGNTFRVIKSFIGGCPSGPGPLNLKYTIPSFVPSGTAILAWTWINFNGNREFYMNCASVNINSQSGNQQQFNSLPGIWVANQESVNSCSSIETQDPVFPDPGPTYELGGAFVGSQLASLKPANASCEVPQGGSYSNPLNIITGQRAAGPLVMAEGAGSAPTTAMAMSMSSVAVIMGAPSPMGSPTSAAGNYALSTTVVPCGTTSGSGTSTITQTSTSTKYVCPSCRPSTLATIATPCDGPMGASSSNMPSNPSSMPPHASSPVSRPQSPPSSSPQPPPPANNIAYADPANLAQYLPCDPGSFICTSANEFYTCDQTRVGWTWKSPRPIAAGMMCLPNLKPASNGQGQQPGAPPGYYRYDQYVRARPFGSCSPDGSIGCRNNGASWMLCDHGGWVDMGSVATGTTCVNGAIVAI